MEVEACSCDYAEDTEPLECMRRSAPVARYVYICEDCGTAIDAGEVYEHIRARSEGQWFSYRSHIACSTMRRHYFCGVMFGSGEMRELLRETLDTDIVTGETYDEYHDRRSAERKAWVADRIAEREASKGEP